MERLGHNPGKPRRQSQEKPAAPPKTPASAASADLHAAPGDATSSPSKVQVSAAAGSLSKDFKSRSHLSRGTGEEDVLPTEGGSDATQPPTRAAALRPAPPSTPAGRRRGLWYPSPALRGGCKGGGRQAGGLRNQRQPEAPGLLGPHSPSSARCCSA